MNDRYMFSDSQKEIIINKFDTPTPWMNYLSNGTFHTMISQAGGGVAFYKSPQIWRINHYRFFHLPTDRSGFYTYIKDGDSVFCPTSQPVKEAPDEWTAVHGMGYTRFLSKKNGLRADCLYFVGPLENCLIWELKLSSDCDRKIKVFPFVELGMMEFMRELQWQCYMKHQMSVYNIDDVLVYKYGVENQPHPEETPLVYFASDVKVSAFDGDRDEFIGAYRSEENPLRVELGKCSNSTMAGGDPCFALQLDIDLKAGEEKTVHIYLGTASDEQDISRAVARCRQSDFAEKSFAKLSENWDFYFDKFSCKLPCENTQRMANIWNPYQAERNFQFSRNISYYATGTFRGVGYRDTAQDILAMIPYNTLRARDKIKLLLSQQYTDGHVNHYFFPVEGWEPVTTIHSDDHLWTVLTIHRLIEEEGTTDFLNEVVEYFDGGEGTVWEHVKKSIDFTMSNLGSRGFPLMLRSDWNDQLFRVCKEGKGESIWTAMQFGLALKKAAHMAELMNEDSAGYRYVYNAQKKLVNELAWDGAWFRRAIMDDGRYLGSDKEEQAKIWLNAQTWSVISEMAEDDKGRKAMDSVYEMLNTPLGIKKIHPSIKDYPSKENPLTNYNKGCGENGAIFCHANTWAIIAECILGNGDRAFEYYHQLLPMVAQQKAGEWRYKAEPYVYSSNIFGPESDKFGLANVSWLSGTAAWMQVAITEYILGIKPVWEGLKIAPCIPKEWDGFTASRKFRGVTYDIEVLKTDGQPYIEVDGMKIDGNVVKTDSKKDSIKVKAFIN
ncbi:MAG: hypothetical protein Q4B04_04600 [bacterium]|nr:hypothetical protein [bacterium]